MEGSNQQQNNRGGRVVDTPLFITAAHELKSPLALIRQLSLTLETGECSDGEAREIARQITLTGEKALRLTTNLTKTVRLEDALFTLEPLNPLVVCNEVVRDLAPLYRAKGRELRVKVRRKPLLGLANRDLLRRILTNFADNALHHTESDGVVVVTATAYDHGQRIRVGVRDYGPALPSAFWRSLDGSSKSNAQLLQARPESSGLGIYIAKQFAQAMQAEIGTIRHRDGATFYVDLYSSMQLRLL